MYIQVTFDVINVNAVCDYYNKNKSEDKNSLEKLNRAEGGFQIKRKVIPNTGSVYDSDPNNLVKQEYHSVYKIKKKIESKFPFVKEINFYKYLMNLIKVRDKYKSVIPTKKLHKIIHNLFSAYPDDRTIEPLKKHISEYM